MEEGFAARLAELRERIATAAGRAGRDPDEVQLLAVSKTHGADRVLEAVRAGQLQFGENRFQEVPEKQAELEQTLGAAATELRWHFIGQLQSNKVRKVLESFDLVQSIDRAKLIRRIDRTAGELGIRARTLLQVKVSGVEDQGGAEPEQVLELIELAAGLENLVVEGLMAIGPNSQDSDRIRRGFADVRELAEGIGPNPAANIRMDTLSMGMSGDFEIAVEEGSTLVRVGSALFGARRIV